MPRFTNLPSFKLHRLRSYIFRLPLFTRLCILVVTLVWILELQTVWSVIKWGSLIPKEVGLKTMYRLNSYPLIHLGFFHALVNILALTPLLERFEAEHGTLTTLALFAGPFGSLPAGLYILIDMFVLRRNTPVLGASVWVFLLMGVEAIKAYRMNPYFNIVSYRIPTWITPLIIALLTSIFIPSASFLGHLCGCVIGYLFGLGYLTILVPPQKPIRWLESKLNLLSRLPHYVSIDQKTYGRYGILPTTNTNPSNSNSSNGLTLGMGTPPSRSDAAELKDVPGSARQTGMEADR